MTGNFMLEQLERKAATSAVELKPYVGLKAMPKCTCEAQGLETHICRDPHNPHPGRMICDCCPDD